MAVVRARRRLARAVHGRLLRKRMPTQREPVAVVRTYSGALLGMVDHLRALARQVLLPALPQLVADATREHVRTDSSAEDATKLMQQLRLRAEQGAFNEAAAHRAAHTAALRTADAQKDALQQQLLVTLGVEVPIFDRALNGQIQNFTAENVVLIQSIPRESLGQMEKLLLNGLSSGMRSEELADEISRRFDVAESRAALIARDQVNRFYGSLNRTRQQGVGITHFFWSASNDERTCEICGPLEGKRFAWNDPPAAGVPGEAHPQCRCTAEPDVDALVESLEE